MSRRSDTCEARRRAMEELLKGRLVPCRRNNFAGFSARFRVLLVIGAMTLRGVSETKTTVPRQGTHEHVAQRIGSGRKVWLDMDCSYHKYVHK